MTGVLRPNKIAPLYNLGSSLFLNFLRFFMFINEENLPNKVELTLFLILM